MFGTFLVYKSICVYDVLELLFNHLETCLIYSILMFYLKFLLAHEILNHTIGSLYNRTSIRFVQNTIVCRYLPHIDIIKQTHHFCRFLIIQDTNNFPNTLQRLLKYECCLVEVTVSPAREWTAGHARLRTCSWFVFVALRSP